MTAVLVPTSERVSGSWRWVWRGLGWLLCCLLWSTAAGAVELDDVAQVRAAGELARRMGDYETAVQAFAQAQEDAPLPAVAYALAETHHQRYLASRSAEDLRRARRWFRTFLALPEKPRVDLRVEARRALASLERLDVTDDTEPEAEPPSVATRLVVRANALSATVSIDGGPKRPLPAFAELAPGRHAVAIEADGYITSSRWADLSADRVHVIDAELRAVPAELVVETTPEAKIYVDGRLVAIAPVEAPLEIEPGPTVVDVVLDGRYPYRTRLDLERGSSNELEADLERTPRRIGATVLLAAGGLGIATAIGTGIAATLDDLAASQASDPGEELRLSLRADDLSVVSGMAAGVGLGWTLFGGIMFVFEEPIQGDGSLTEGGDEDARLRVMPGPGDIGIGAEVRF